MILSIKKCLFAWFIFDNNKNIVSKIKSKRFLGLAKKVINSNNITVYTTDIINEPDSSNDRSNSSFRKYVLYKSGEPIVVASLTFANNSESAMMTLRPPQVDEMLLETPSGLLRAKRQNDNGIIYYQNEQQICKISPFFRFKQQFIEFYDEYNITFFAGLYVLAEYMMHEDDLVIV